MRALLALPAVAALLFAQEHDADGVYRITGAIQAPKLVTKVDPTYSKAAQDAGVQGIVGLTIVIGTDGLPAEIKVISPLGFGLDQKAIEAVNQWRFKPGRIKGGPAVPVRANVEVHFVFRPGGGLSNEERQRSDFNQALNRLKPAGTADDPAKATILKLKEKKHPAAQLLAGMWLMEGSYLPKDEQAGIALIQSAAKSNYGPAIYYLGLRYLTGEAGEVNENRGWSMILEAAAYGSAAAQHRLGYRYEYGDGDLGIDNQRAEGHYRQCALASIVECQAALGRLLVSDSLKRVEGMAWLELASDGGSVEAKELFASELRLTPADQQAQARAMKKILFPN